MDWVKIESPKCRPVDGRCAYTSCNIIDCRKIRVAKCQAEAHTPSSFKEISTTGTCKFLVCRENPGYAIIHNK